MRTPEQKAEHAAYMREYYKKPENKLKKKLCDANHHDKHREEANEKSHQRYVTLTLEQKEQRRIQSLNWKRNNKEKLKGYKRTYYSKETTGQKKIRIHKDIIRNKKNWQSNPQPIRDYNNKKYNEKRINVIKHYSNGTMKCVKCCMDEFDALVIDHINNGGCKHAKERHGNALVNWIISHHYPEGYQILCMNCNIKKEVLRKSLIVRTGQRAKNYKYENKYCQKVKMELFKHYSNGTIACKICGTIDIDVLTIDHVDGGGAEHRRSIGIGKRSGIALYRWLRRNKYPIGFQVLCFSHQFIKQKKEKECSGRPRILAN